MDSSRPKARRKKAAELDLRAPRAYINRELSWLAFVWRVVALAGDPSLPLVERVRFAGIAGMLHDEFFIKRMSGLRRQIAKGSKKLSLDGRTPKDEYDACRKTLRRQVRELARVLRDELRPALAKAGRPLLDWDELSGHQRHDLRRYCRDAVLPIVTPLVVDAEHPFPFISSLGLNLAVLQTDQKGRERFVRIKVPANRPRWVAVGEGGVVPLEQVVAANLDLLYPRAPPAAVYTFRVTRGMDGPREEADHLEEQGADEPGSILEQVGRELKARRFAGVVRIQVDRRMPKRIRAWLADQLDVAASEVYADADYLRLSDLMQLDAPSESDLVYPPHCPATHPRLGRIDPDDNVAIFEEIARGDILLHHPYHSFDASVLRLIESAARDPRVLAIKLTIYRTSSDSPIVRALAEAARRGKQVAVVVEVTARFDEAPNIAWGKYLEQEGVHVAYGVERLKTHVKLALVVREEAEAVRCYAHVGTGNYHSRTARVYEDVGLLTGDANLCENVAAVFNMLTGRVPFAGDERLLVAPVTMRERFTQLIRREARHARHRRECGIDAKMNQLQDPQIIRELYKASQAGVPITLNVRGLCCLRPGVAGLSQTIRVFSVVGRFLEHSRLYRFANDGAPEHYIGSADWMRRNLNSRVETIAQVTDRQLKVEIDEILATYAADNCSAWDCEPDGSYRRRAPRAGEERRAAQDVFMRRAAESSRAAGSRPGGDARAGSRESRPPISDHALRSLLGIDRMDHEAKS